MPFESKSNPKVARNNPKALQGFLFLAFCELLMHSKSPVLQHLGCCIFWLATSHTTLPKSLEHPHVVFSCKILCQPWGDFMCMESNMQYHMQFHCNSEATFHVIFMLETIKDQMVKVSHLESSIHKLVGFLCWQTCFTFANFQNTRALALSIANIILVCFSCLS